MPTGTQHPASTDVLIVGQGLAGTLLAWQLIRRGVKVCVVDREQASSASSVAAGLITPVTGKRLALSWRLAEMLPAARAFYEWIEHRLGQRFLHPREIVRLYRTEDEQRRGRARLEDPTFSDWVDAAPQDWLQRHRSGARLGGLRIRGGGYLEVASFLRASRAAFEEAGAYCCREVEVNAISFESEGVRVGEIEAKRVILCQGWEGGANRWFDWVPFRSAKGEILALSVPFDAGESGATRILQRGTWLLPREKGDCLAGSTYGWDPLDHEPTEEGRAAVEEGLVAMGLPGFRVIGHRAAVRPIIRESRARVGLHPSQPRLGFFNGLGSKGVLNGPYYAAMLAGHLAEGEPIEAEADLRANF